MKNNKYRPSSQVFFLISKLMLIWYLILFTGVYLFNPTGAVFTEKYEVQSRIHVDWDVEENKETEEPPKDDSKEQPMKEEDTEIEEEVADETEEEKDESESKETPGDDIDDNEDTETETDESAEDEDLEEPEEDTKEEEGGLSDENEEDV